VVRGSGISAGGLGLPSGAAVYGRTGVRVGALLRGGHALKREVLPEHVAAALLRPHRGATLTLTTGLHIPVDAGVPAAFLR